MATLTPAQVYALARSAGFDPPTAALMTAIAGAESGWRTDAVGDVALQDAKWGPSIGLWQIRSLRAQAGTGGPRDATRLTDPAFNAASAYAIYRGQGLRAWSVYSSGRYRQFLPQAEAAAGQPAGPLPPTSSPADGAAPAGGGPNLTPAALFGGGAANPLNWPGAIGTWLGDQVAGSLWRSIQPFALTSLFAAGGIGLVVAGAAAAARVPDRVTTAVTAPIDDARAVLGATR